MQSRAMKIRVSVWEGAEEVQSIIHIKAEKCKKMKLSQDMQLIQKLRHDQKRMKKVFEVMSGRNIVTNSRVTPSWREIVSLTFSEAGVLHVNWTSFGHCVPPEKVFFILVTPSPPPPLPPFGASGASGTTGASDSAQDPPPPPPSSTTNRGDKSQSSAAPGSSKTTAITEYIAWTTTTSRLKPAASSVPEDVLMHEESDFEAQDMGYDDEDSGSRHIPKVSLNQEWFKPLFEKERPATPKPAWSIPSSSLPVPNNNWASALASFFVPPSENSLLSQTGDGRLTPKHLEGHAYEVVKAFHPDVTIQIEFFFNKDLKYLRFGHKGDRLALSITKMKAASYLDAGLEQMVPYQMWAEEEYMYDISASYGISHWWFKRQQFNIDRHSADTNRRAIVRTHMRILSVVRIEVFSLYGYDYMKKIVLRRADNKEYTIAESDFKDLYPSDFEDLYLLNLQGLDFMHDYKIIDSPWAVVFRDKYGMQMIMHFNKIHKFWTKNDVIKSKQFMFAIQKRLKLKRIFRNLESFVGGRIREGDYRLLQRIK
ncbi:hypothetical protein Tco_0865027 [Tanacetum coccineum]